MDLTILLTCAAAVVGIAAFGLLIRKLASGPKQLPVTVDWIDELSIERYRPMLRLLSDDDVAYLKSQPGYTPRLGRRFRAQRCQIFLGYLNWLQSDFDRVCTALRVVMVESQSDRPDLAVFLLRQRMAFRAGLVAIYGRLVLYRLGLAGVDVEDVMTAFNSLRIELRQLVPSASGLEA